MDLFYKLFYNYLIKYMADCIYNKQKFMYDDFLKAWQKYKIQVVNRGLNKDEHKQKKFL